MTPDWFLYFTMDISRPPFLPYIITYGKAKVKQKVIFFKKYMARLGQPCEPGWDKIVGV